MKRASLLIFCCGLAVAGRAEASLRCENVWLADRIQSDQVIRQLTTAFTRVMGGASDRIWPGYSWKGLKVVLIGAERSKQRVVDVTTGEISSLANEQLPSGALASAYSFFDVSGQHYMSIGADGTKDPLRERFALGIHEAFHRYGQAGWKAGAHGGPRGTTYPIHWEPRYQRFMLYNRLKEAYENPAMSDANLRHAAYWFNLWRTQYPKEVLSTSDGYEGTANYAELVAESLRFLGNAASETQIHEDQVKRVLPIYSYLMQTDRLAFDGEGYGIGGLASLIMRGNVNFKGWEQRVALGETPAEILLSKLTAEPDADDTELRAKLQATATVEQGKADALLGPAFKLLAEKGGVIVSFPIGWHAGSFATSGFYIDETSGVTLAPMMQALEFNSPAGDGKAIVNVNATMILDIPSPANNPSHWQFVLPKTSVTQKDDRIKVDDPNINGEFNGTCSQSADGRSWFCAK